MLNKMYYSDMSSMGSMNGFMVTLGESECPHGIPSFKKKAWTEFMIEQEQYDDRPTFSTSAAQHTQLY